MYSNSMTTKPVDILVCFSKIPWAQHDTVLRAIDTHRELRSMCRLVVRSEQSPLLALHKFMLFKTTQSYATKSSSKRQADLRRPVQHPRAWCVTFWAEPNPNCPDVQLPKHLENEPYLTGRSANICNKRQCHSDWTQNKPSKQPKPVRTRIHHLFRDFFSALGSFSRHSFGRCSFGRGSFGRVL